MHNYINRFILISWLSDLKTHSQSSTAIWCRVTHHRLFLGSLTMRHVSLSGLLTELATAVWTLNPVIIFLWRGLVSSTTSVASLTATATSASLHGAHCCPELFRLLLPLWWPATSLNRHFFASTAWHLLLLRGCLYLSWDRVIWSFLLFHKKLFVFVRNDSVLLAVKSLPLLLENLFANIHMLVEGIVVKVSSAVRALMKIQALRLCEGFGSETALIIFLKSRDNLLINFIFIVVKRSRLSITSIIVYTSLLLPPVATSGRAFLIV